MHQKSGWVEVKVSGPGESSGPKWGTNRPVLESALSALLDGFHFTLDVPVDHWTEHFNSRPSTFLTLDYPLSPNSEILPRNR